MVRERKFSTEELFQAVKHILLKDGYEGFTFSLLAATLNVSRAALYKYYRNKEELILDFMIFEMDQSLDELKEIEKQEGFEAQFDYLFHIMFKKTGLQKLIGIGQQIPVKSNSKVDAKREILDQLHLDMYKYLQNFIVLGREEGKLKSHLPDSLMLGIIFQSVAIPNHFEIPHEDWVNSIKEILTKGMLINK